MLQAFIATAVAAFGTTKTRLRKLGYEAKNFRVTVLSQSSVVVYGVYDLGTVLMAAECGL